MKAAVVRNFNSDLRNSRRCNTYTTTERRSAKAVTSHVTAKVPHQAPGNMTKVKSSGSEVEPEDRESIEKLLRFSETDESIVLSSIECSPGSRLGDNYMSIVKRVRVRGRRNGNEGNIEYVRAFRGQSCIHAITRSLRTFTN